MMQAMSSSDPESMRLSTMPGSWASMADPRARSSASVITSRVIEVRAVTPLDDATDSQFVGYLEQAAGSVARSRERHGDGVRRQAGQHVGRAHLLEEGECGDAAGLEGVFRHKILRRVGTDHEANLTWPCRSVCALELYQAGGDLGHGAMDCPPRLTHPLSSCGHRPEGGALRGFGGVAADQLRDSSPSLYRPQFGTAGG